MVDQIYLSGIKDTKLIRNDIFLIYGKSHAIVIYDVRLLVTKHYHSSVADPGGGASMFLGLKWGLIYYFLVKNVFCHYLYTI